MINNYQIQILMEQSVKLKDNLWLDLTQKIMTIEHLEHLFKNQHLSINKDYNKLESSE